MRAFAAFLTLLLAAPAFAASERQSWNWAELRMPTPAPKGGWLPNAVRVWSEARIAPFDGGMRQLFVRAGPLWDLHDNLLLAVHFTANPNSGPATRLVEEYRVELEPNLRGRLGLFTYNDRNRLEYRWIDGETRFRYRNQLRVNYQPEGATFFPFVWDEVLVDLSGLGFTQNRAVVGLAWTFQPNTRFEVGYMLRTRHAAATGWESDHVLTTTLYFAPERP